MTKRRRRLLIVLAVAALLGGTLALSPVHWWLYGTWRGEPFYRGWPASYCVARARKAVRLGAPKSVRDFTTAEALVRDYLSQTFADLVWGGPPPFHDWSGLPRLRGMQPDLGPEAIPVLTVLAGDADAGVRFYAAIELQTATVDDPALSVPCLVQLLDDDDPWVRYMAAEGLGRCGPAACVAIPKLRALVGDSASPTKGMVVGWVASGVLKRLERFLPKSVSEAGDPP
jgi:hypothetical protein